MSFFIYSNGNLKSFGGPRSQVTPPLDNNNNNNNNNSNSIKKKKIVT